MCVNSPCIKPGIQIMMLHCLKYLKYTFVRVEVILYVDMLGCCLHFADVHKI